jgi:hypothetical protein
LLILPAATISSPNISLKLSNTGVWIGKGGRADQALAVEFLQKFYLPSKSTKSSIFYFAFRLLFYTSAFKNFPCLSLA